MRRRAFLLRLAAAGTLLALAACRHGGSRVLSGHPYPSALPILVTKRLELAREVAWTKFHTGSPIHDPVREAELLADLVAQAPALDRDPVWVEKFFSAQLAASRAVQMELHAAWRSNPASQPSTPPRDLRTDLRPRLDELTARLLQALPRKPEPQLAEGTSLDLGRAGFSSAVAKLATDPLR